MVLIYQTAHPPVIFQAKLISVASIFHFICTLLKYILPVLACYFYIDYASGTTFDNELPSVIPGGVISYFSKNKSNTFQYPPDQIPTYPILIASTPKYNQGKLDSWKISIKIPHPDASKMQYVNVFFNFTVNLRKFATNTISTMGSFTRSFPVGVNYIQATGDLKLEQNEIINFRGSFNNTKVESQQLDDYESYAAIQQAQEELDTFFYVDWDEPITRIGKYMNFELDLEIKIKEITIIHSIPLISSLESFLVLYLSALLFTKLILDHLQSFLFRNGIIKTWITPLYEAKETTVSSKMTSFH